jgi:hypothetical protein
LGRDGAERVAGHADLFQIQSSGQPIGSAPHERPPLATESCPEMPRFSWPPFDRTYPRCARLNHRSPDVGETRPHTPGLPNVRPGTGCRPLTRRDHD